MDREHVRETFPELDDLEDPDLRVGVVDAWASAMADTGIEDLGGVPWLPPVQRELGLDDEYLVPHVRDVVACATAMVDRLTARRPDLAIDRDVVLAGALVHDVSKLYEFDGGERTAIGGLLGHPHYGVAVVDAAGLPVDVAHVVLAHTDRTAVEPATIEAEVVRRADEVAAQAIRSRALADLRDA
ncbi:MAG: HD domain-containing protein [Haloarculaceae archaeon]